MTIDVKVAAPSRPSHSRPWLKNDPSSRASDADRFGGKRPSSSWTQPIKIPTYYLPFVNNLRFIFVFARMARGRDKQRRNRRSYTTAQRAVRANEKAQKTGQQAVGKNGKNLTQFFAPKRDDPASTGGPSGTNADTSSDRHSIVARSAGASSSSVNAPRGEETGGTTAASEADVPLPTGTTTRTSNNTTAAPNNDDNNNNNNDEDDDDTKLPATVPATAQAPRCSVITGPECNGTVDFGSVSASFDDDEDDDDNNGSDATSGEW